MSSQIVSILSVNQNWLTTWLFVYVLESDIKSDTSDIKYLIWGLTCQTRQVFANSLDPDQTALEGRVWLGSTLLFCLHLLGAMLYGKTTLFKFKDYSIFSGIWTFTSVLRCLSHVMGLWYFSSSVNSFFKCACTTIQWGGCPGSPEPSLVAYVISTIISWGGSFIVFENRSCIHKPYSCIWILLLELQFKTNNVISLRDVKISNILYIKTLPFFARKMWGAFAVQTPHIFSAKNISTLDFRRTRRLNESLTNDFVKLTMLWTTGP